MNYALIDETIATPEPRYATSGSGAFDLVATSKRWVPRTFNEKKGKFVGGYFEYGTNLAFEIPTGFLGVLAPKSSGSDVSELLANSIGFIDSDYRGEVRFRYKPDGTTLRAYLSSYEAGEQCGQMAIFPIHVVSAFTRKPLPELTRTERGTGGFGSTSEKKDDPTTVPVAGTPAASTGKASKKSSPKPVSVDDAPAPAAVATSPVAGVDETTTPVVAVSDEKVD